MYRGIVCFVSVTLLLAWAGGLAVASPLQQDSGPDGIVSVEAENYDLYTERTNTWILITEVADGFVPADGFSGGFALQSTPTDLGGGGGITSDIETRSPQLDYEINFVKTGTYYIWLLAYGMDGNSDSCHAGLDGVVVDTATVLSGFNGDYGWHNELMSSSEIPRIEVTTTGVHTFNIWMRETGSTIDKIVLTSNPDYTPTGFGPPESSRGARVKASGAIPSVGGVDIPRDVILGWSASATAVAHDVYFGSVLDDVNAASRDNPLGVLLSEGQADTSFDPDGVLEFGQTYYWRIDEVNAAPDSTVFRGDLWSFTVEPLAYPVENITATASSVHTADMGPEKTVDGSGLDENDLHSLTVTEMWLSGGTDPGPPWIQYEFDNDYKLYEMWLWNSNQSIESFVGMGAKDITIEHSMDAVEWTVLDGVPEIPQAPGLDGYAHGATLDLGGVVARYVKITINDNWGLLNQSGLSEVRFYYIPVIAREPQPASGAIDLDLDVTLSWRAGREAATHEIYFDTDEAAVADGSALMDVVSERTYVLGDLEYGQTYYWKINGINEVESPSVWEGNVWNFSTIGYFVVDDMESYNDDLDAGTAIFQTWIDGWDNGTGATVGYLSSPFAEQSIVNGGTQSMPLDYNNVNSPWYSETERTWDTPQNWTVNGVTHLTVNFRGNAVGFLETAPGSFTIGAAGADIWNAADEFRFVFKKLNGDGSIVAKVESLVDTDPWAKAGVMVRETLDAGSTFAGVYITPGNGCRFQERALTNGSATSDTSVVTSEQTAISAPYWVKLERTGDVLNGFYSADGVTWVSMSWNPQTVNMIGNVYVGIAVTSHVAGVPTTAEVSNVSTTGNVSGSWQAVAIGVEQPANDGAPLYVAVEDSNGKVKAITHPDENATLNTTWQEWNIPLSEFTDAGVNMAKVEKMYVGVGDRDNPTPDGAGLLYIDDIRVSRPAPEEVPSDD